MKAHTLTGGTVARLTGDKLSHGTQRSKHAALPPTSVFATRRLPCQARPSLPLLVETGRVQRDSFGDGFLHSKIQQRFSSLILVPSSSPKPDQGTCSLSAIGSLRHDPHRAYTSEMEEIDLSTSNISFTKASNERN